MKKYVTLFALLCVCFGVSAQAQTLKFGHINIEEVVNLMPERDSAWIKLQSFVAELEETFVEMQTEQRNKYTEYQQRYATWSAAILETKQRELNEIGQRIEEFQQRAQEDVAQMQNIYFAPVHSKANEAIQKVAKELGLIYVFNSAGMPYIDENQSIDLLPKVKQELKIPAEKVAPTMIGDQNQR